MQLRTSADISDVSAKGLNVCWLITQNTVHHGFVAFIIDSFVEEMKFK